MTTRCAALVLLTLPALSGCYLAHLASGQLRLINDQLPLADAVERERDPTRRALLREVPRVRRFAVETVRLSPSDSYVGYFPLDRPWLTLILSAAPPDGLEPYTRWYPFAGRVPYRSFFDEQRARRAERALRERGFDTYLHESPAYSTLGFFRDPVTTPMLERAPPCPAARRAEQVDRCQLFGLVETLLHELTHQHLYVRGETDFNEQLASFVARRGAIQYMERRGYYDAELRARLEVAFERQRAFAKAVSETAAQLRALYARPIPLADKLRARRPIFRALQRRGVELFPGSTPRDWPENNAQLLQYLRYDRDAARMTELWRRAGQRWERFWTLVRAQLPR